MTFLLKVIFAEAEHFLMLLLGFGRFSRCFSYKSFLINKRVLSNEEISHLIFKQRHQLFTTPLLQIYCDVDLTGHGHFSDNPFLRHFACPTSRFRLVRYPLLRHTTSSTSRFSDEIAPPTTTPPTI